MPSLECGRPNREEERDSPASPLPSKQPFNKTQLPTSTVVNLGDIGERKEEVGVFQKWRGVLLVVVLVALCVSEALQWARPYTGCPYHVDGPRTSAPSPNSQEHEPKMLLPGPMNKVGEMRQYDLDLHRSKRNADSVYITQDQFLVEKASLQAEIRRSSSHPSGQYSLKGYTTKHEVVNQASLYWTSQSTLFTLTAAGKDLEVRTPGTYHVSLSVMFNGRTHLRGVPSCSLKVVVKSSSSVYTTLMFVSTTQDQRGLLVGTYYPIDTAHGSGIFQLNAGDKLHVKPDNWSLGCRISTEATKTHMDINLLERSSA